MNRLSSQALRTWGAAAALLMAGAAAAQSPASQAQQRYQQERAVCMSGTSNQERSTCLREASAALQESRRGGLSTVNEGELAQNRKVRCEALPAPDRHECMLRMQGEGTVSGSAQQGGILREITGPAR